MRRPITPMDVRFDARVDRSGGPDACWPWTGARSSAGYGIVTRGRRGAGWSLTHRYAWERANCREIPAGMYICHRCDNPCCCNPAHLFVGTPTDNMVDASTKRRLSQPGKSQRGERNPIAKLSDARVVAARSMFAAGMSHREIADLAGVTESCIQHAVSGKNFKHLPGAISAELRP